MLDLFGERLTQPKRFFEGTHRTRPPRETLSAYAGVMKPLGITRLANVTGLDCIGIPVYQAIRPNARSLSVSQGKGLDADAAKASALMEAIELWHAEHFHRPLRHESYEAMRRALPTADVGALPLRIGAQLQPDRPLLWTEGFDLLRGEPTWVPFELVTMNTVLSPGQRLTFYASSNGLASGNHVLEATAHGLCEVIERDTEALHALAGAEGFVAHKLDPASITDAACQALLSRFAEAGVEVAITDQSAHSGIPTFAVAITDAEDRPRWRRLGVFWGSGTHLSPAVALVRALTEAAQGRLTAIAGSRDDNPHAAYARLATDQEVRLARDALFAPRPTLELGERPSLATNSFEGDIAVLLDALRRLGIEQAVAVDLRRPEVDVPVVKLVVPGLEVQGHGHPAQRGRRAHERHAELEATR